MVSARGRLSVPFALFLGSAVAILAGASFNASGRTAETAVLALVAALLFFAGGALYRWWRYGAGLAVVGAVITIATYHARLRDPSMVINLAGGLALVLGGILASYGYERINADLRRRVDDLSALNRRLEEQHRVFLAATEDPTTSPDTLQTLAANTARQLSSPVCGYWIVAAEGTHFVPHEPGFGLEHFRSQAVDRRRASGDLQASVEADREFETAQTADLRAVFAHIPADFRFDAALVVPMRVADRVGGFMLVAGKPGGYSADDRRLARSIALRAGAFFASLHAVSLSRREAARYALLNDIVREASGLSFEQVIALVLDRGRDLARHDAARVAVFEGGLYRLVGGSPVPAPIAGSPLAGSLAGTVVLRRNVTSTDGFFSGLQVPEGGAGSEALVPISGRQGVIGAICLGRKGSAGFGDRDLPTLDELGAMAGVAVENAHVLERVSGQATKLDTALNALGEISQALTAVTEGAAVLERKTLESASRLFGVRHALLTRALENGRHRVVDALGFGESVHGAEIPNGQGVVGAAMLSGEPVSITDLATNWDLKDEVLAGMGVRGALTVPIREGGTLWGSLSVFDVSPREWSTDDVRVLATLGNESVVAVKNAELYDASKKMIWELSNLHEGITAVTSTLELDQVLDIVLGWAARAAQAQIGCIALLEKGQLQVAGVYGTDRATAGRLVLEIGADVVRDVVESGKPIMDAVNDDRAGSGPLHPRAVLCVPILLRDKPTGVVFLANYQAGRPFTEDHQRLLTALGAQSAIAIDNAKLFKDRQELFIGSLKALASAVDARDPYTAGHSRRVTAYSMLIAREMQWETGNRDAWQRLEQGGLLHDIGKIAVPDAILAKPSRLTDQEFDVMKSHAARGWDILHDLTMLTDELLIVRHHHERFDGKGYPDRLRGDQLPIFVWIVSAADAFDAMTSDRPYRKGMSVEVALSEVAKGSGSHFHPVVAQAVQAAAAAGRLGVLEQESMYTDAPSLGAFENPVAP